MRIFSFCHGRLSPSRRRPDDGFARFWYCAESRSQRPLTVEHSADFEVGKRNNSNLLDSSILMTIYDVLMLNYAHADDHLYR
jgi:hypothetical protein